MMADPDRRVAHLQTLRLRLFRLRPSRPIRGSRSAAAFIKERRLVLSTGRASLPMLAEAIAGRHLAGGWMAHPEVYRIYHLLGRIHTHPEVVAVPLILGKETLVHSSLAPTVQRVASDSTRCDQVRRSLPPLARRLLDQVESEGQVRMDRWDVRTDRARKARLLLEREMVVVSKGLHTEDGYHTSVVMPWSRSRVAERFAPEARRLDFARAVDAILLAGVRSAVIAPEREVRRWLVTGAERVEVLLAEGELQRLRVGRTSWLTVPQRE